MILYEIKNIFNVKDNLENISDLNESKQNNNNNNDIIIRDINDLNNKYGLINFKLSCSFDSFISIFIFSIKQLTFLHFVQNKRN